MEWSRKSSAGEGAKPGTQNPGSFLLGAVKRQAVETESGFLFNLRGLFLQSVGFPFDSQGPGSSRNFLLLLSHYKAIENGNQTCSLGLVGRMT